MGTTTLLFSLEANEQLGIVSNGTSYTFTSSSSMFTPAGATDPANQATAFSGFLTNTLTLTAAGLAQYGTVAVTDTAAGASVVFNDSGANGFSTNFAIDLHDSPAVQGLTFNGASSFGPFSLNANVDTEIAVGPLASLSTSDGGITLQANQQAAPGPAISLSPGGTITATGSGSLTLTGDSMSFIAPATISAASGIVTLRQESTGTPIDVGLGSTLGALDLSDAMLGQVTAGILRIGRADNNGGITVTGPVTPHAGFNTLSLLSGGAISENPAATIAVTNLEAQGAGGVNLGEANLVSAIAGSTSNQAFTFVDAGPVAAGTVTLTVAGPSASIGGLSGIDAGTGDVTLTVGTATATGILMSADPNDNVADVSGRTVTLTALGPSNGSTGQIGFLAGGVAQFLEVAATTINATTDDSRIWLSAIGGAAVGSVSAGTEFAILRTVNGGLTSTHTGSAPDVIGGTVVLQSPGTSGSFGTGTNPLLVQTSTLRAGVTGTGLINIANVDGGGDLSVASATTSSGGIKLAVAGGNLIVTGTTGTIVSAPGNTVTLMASGAIVSGTSAGVTDVAGDSLAVGGATGVGTSPSPLKTAIADLAIAAGAAGVWLDNTGLLMVGNLGVTGEGSINITSTGPIAISGEVIAPVGPIHLTAGDQIAESVGGLVDTFSTLAISASGGITLNGNNAVGALIATNTRSGNVAVTNVGTMLMVFGISEAGGGSITVNGTGSIDIDGPVSAAAGGAINLAASMLVSESSVGMVITTGTLTTVSTAATYLNGLNSVSDFHATSLTGGVSLVNTANPLTITGISAGAGDIYVTNQWAMTISNPVTTAPNGNISLIAAGDLTIGAAVTAGGSGTVTLRANVGSDLLLNATVTSSSGILTASAGHAITESGTGAFSTRGLLTTDSTAGQTLNSANAVGIFHATNTTGDISLSNTFPGLTITGISESSPGRVTVTNTGSITTAGTVSAAAGSITIAASSDLVVNAAVTTPGAVTLQRTGQSNGAITLNAVVTGSPINIQGNTGDDTITINITGPNDGTHTLTLDGRDGSDTYVINLVSPVGTVVSPIHINDTGTTGTDSAIINGGTSNNVVTVTATAVTTLAGGLSQTVTYAGLESMTISIGIGTNSVTVESTAGPALPTAPLGTPVTIGGSASYVVSSTPDAAGVLTGILAPVTINAGPGSNSLVVSELGSTTADDVVLTQNTIFSSRGTFAAIRYSATGRFSNVVLRTGVGGHSFVNVQGTAANVGLTTAGTFGGNNTVTVSSVADAGGGGIGVLSAIQGPLAVDAGTGTNFLWLSEVASTTADRVILTQNALTSLLATFAPISYTAAGSFSNVVLRTGAGDDFVNVRSTAANVALTTVATFGGNDNIVVSSTPDATGVLSGLQGSLAVDGGAGTNVLSVSEEASTTADNVVLTQNTVSSNVGTFRPISYVANGGSFSNVVLRTGAGDDAVNVRGTAANAALTTVGTFGGNDTIVVSSNPDATGLLTGIRGPLAVDGGTGTNVLWVSELASTAADNVVLTQNTVTSTLGTFAPISYAAGGGTFSNVVLRTGAGNDFVNVQGTAANVALTTVGTFGGNDTITVSSVAGDGGGIGVLAGIRGALAIDAGAGTNTLWVSEVASTTADHVVLTQNTVSSGADAFAPITYTASGGTFTNVVLRTGAGDDFVNVRSTAANVTLTTVGTFGGNDTITVSSAVAADGTGIGVLSGIQGPLAVDGGLGTNVLLVSELASTTGDSIILAQNTIVSTLGAFAPISYAAGGTFSNVVLRTGAGDDFVNVRGTAGNVTLTSVVTFGGNDTIVVSSTPDATGLLTGIRGPLAVDAGTGTNVLVVSELASTVADSVVLTQTMISSTQGSFAPISYAASGGTFSNVVLRTGAGDDAVNVRGTAANAALTTVGTFGGNDTIVVSSTPDAAGVLTALRGPLAVDAGTGTNTLWVSELAGTTGDNVILTQNTIVSAPGTFAPISYTASGTFGNVILRTGAGDDTVNVQSTAANVALTIVGTFGGNDAIVVSSTPDGSNGSLSGLHGALSVDAGPGANRLTVSESGSTTADQVLLTDSSVTSTLATPAFAPIYYQASGGNFGGTRPVVTSAATTVQAGLLLLLPQASDVLHVTGQLPNSPTYVAMGTAQSAGAATIDVTPASHYQGFTVDMEGGFDILNVNDIAGGAAATRTGSSSLTSGTFVVSYAGANVSIIDFINVVLAGVFSGGRQIA
jgi:hypothetical protein